VKPFTQAQQPLLLDGQPFAGDGGGDTQGGDQRRVLGAGTQPRSWSPPKITGSSRTPSRTYRAPPTPFGAYSLWPAR
jgi:hypothetical protein